MISSEKKSDINNNNIRCDINIVALSNITLEPFFSDFLNTYFSGENTLNIDVLNILNYKEKSIEIKLQKADYILVCINFECDYPDITTTLILNKESLDDVIKHIYERCANLYNYIKKILAHVFCGLVSKIIVTNITILMVILFLIKTL